MGAAAAIIVRRQRDIVDTFRSASATTAAAARNPGELGVEEDMIFKGLIRRAVIRDAGNGRYYLDELSWNALGSLRRRLVTVALLVAVIAVAAILLTARHLI